MGRRKSSPNRGGVHDSATAEPSPIAIGPISTAHLSTSPEEKQGVKQTVPLAVLCGLSVSAFVYVLANVAYFVVLTPQQILNSSAVATTFAQNTIGPGSYAMPALIGFLMLGSVNAEIFAWSRYILAGSRRGMMPTIWSLIHPENDSPRAAVFTHAFLCMMFCLIGDVYTLVSYLTITALMSTMFSVAALIYIKWRSVPVSTNAVKFHIFWPILNLFVNIALLIIPVLAEPIKSGIGFGLFVLGIGCYFIFYRPNKKLQFLSAVDAAITYCGQQVFWTVVDKAPLYKKEVEVSAEQNSEGRTKRSISTVSEIVSNDDSNGQRIEYEASQQLSTTKL